MSMYSIAAECVARAVAQAAEQGIAEDDLLRALLGTVSERYRGAKGVEDLKAILTYQLDHAAGDEDMEFMRP